MQNVEGLIYTLLSKFYQALVDNFLIKLLLHFARKPNGITNSGMLSLKAGVLCSLKLYLEL